MAFTAKYIIDLALIKLQNDELYSRADVLASLNRAKDQFLLYTSYTRSPWQCMSRPGVREVDLPDRTLYVKTVEYDGIPMRLETHQEFVRTAGDAFKTVGTPNRFYFRADENGFFLGLNRIPDVAKQITAFLVMALEDVVDESTVIQIPRPFANGIVHWVCADLLENDAPEENSDGYKRAAYHQMKADKDFDQATAFFGFNTKRKVNRVTGR